MSELTLKWDWVTEAPLHCGSGLARPGYADRLVQRDRRGWAYIPADAVKGALRMSAEQVLAWLGKSQVHVYQAKRQSEPVHGLLISLFGGEGQHHYEKAAAKAEPLLYRTASTAIARGEGRARPETLRTVELVARETRFECGCSVWLSGDADRQRAERTLLLAALAAAESLGGKSGTGWGRVRIENLEVNGCKVGESENLIAPEDIANLRSHLDAGPSKEADRSGATVATSRGARWFRLDLTLAEATTVGTGADISNRVLTADSIPATTLRGALRQVWKRAGCDEGAIAQWLGPSSRWTAALPVVDERLCFPTPLCLLQPKDASNDEDVKLVNLLWRDPAEGEQHRPLRPGWMQWSPSDGLLADVSAQVGREIRMHVARNYATGSKRTGALFAREAMLPERRFQAFVQVPDNVEQSTLVYLGKRRSVGQGKTALVWQDNGTQPEPCWDRPPDQQIDGENPDIGDHGQEEDASQGQTDKDVVVQLLAPALVLDDQGYPLRSLDKSWWAARVQGIDASDINEVPTSSARRTLASWMADWGHPRAADAFFEAGSVWGLRCATKEAATKLRTQLEADGGIGERRHEGFGWIAVDPPWLRKADPKLGSRKAIGATGSDARSAWPGCEGVNTRALEAIVDALNEKLPSLPREVRAPLQELARLSLEEGPVEVMNYCRSRSNRPNPAAWKALATDQPAYQVLEQQEQAGNPEHFRFTLEALLIRANSAAKEE